VSDAFLLNVLGEISDDWMETLAYIHVLRSTQNGNYWTAHANNDTLHAYGRLLHSFVHALLATLMSGYEGYRFPMTDEQIELGKHLLVALDQDTPVDLKDLHAFASPIFLVRDHSSDDMDYTKWNELIECLLAIHALSPDGNFAEPKAVTQPFAMVEYHCRGFVLYEAISRIHEHGNDPYK
jgi:hypothetical protein